MKKVLKFILDTAVYFLSVALVAVILALPLKLLLGPSEGTPIYLRLFVNGAILLIAVAIVHWIMRRRGWTSFSESGWFHGLANLKALGVGAIGGVIMIGLTLGLLLLSGSGKITGADGGFAEYANAFIPLFFSIGTLAIAEEVLFRGYLLAKLASLTGQAWANITISILFALAHLGNDGSNGLILLNIFLGSMVLGLVRFTRWGVPAAGGFHAAWNLIQVLLGSTLSGEVMPVPAVRLVTSGSLLTTGGPFGPEGSLWATVATLAILVALILAARRLNLERAVPLPSALFKRSGETV